MKKMEYRLVQFLQNPMREEGKNIGVIAFNDRWAGFKSIGMIEGQTRPDLSRFTSLSGDQRSIWAFGEWIEWFKALCVDSKGNHEIIHSELDGLENHSPQFVATNGGYYETDERDPESALDQLFKELVGQPKGKTKPAYKDMLDQVLMMSEIIFRSGFEQDIEVTIEPRGNQLPVVFTLDYYLESEKRVGFKSISFHRAKTGNLDMKINDTIYAFTEAQNFEFLDKERCVVLCDSPPESRMTYIERLKQVATVIDITERDAAGQIARVCAAS